MPPRAPLYLSVPAGTRPTPCRACRQPLYFVQSATGKWVPVDCVAGGDPECHDPTALSDGVGVNHYTTCTDPARFRRGRSPGGART